MTTTTFANAWQAMEAAEQALRDAMPAPEDMLPAPLDIYGHPVCPGCLTVIGEIDDVSIVEIGYRRYTATGWAEGRWVCTTNGWDDMADDGCYEFMLCNHCDAMLAPPVDREYD